MWRCRVSAQGRPRGETSTASSRAPSDPTPVLSAAPSQKIRAEKQSDHVDIHERTTTGYSTLSPLCRSLSPSLSHLTISRKHVSPDRVQPQLAQPALGQRRVRRLESRRRSSRLGHGQVCQALYVSLLRFLAGGKEEELISLGVAFLVGTGRQPSLEQFVLHHLDLLPSVGIES